MGRHDRTEFYRNNRDYGSLLDDEEADGEEEEEEEEEQEDNDHRHQDREESPPPDYDLSHECQEYFERRQRLKELERERLRKSLKLGQDQSGKNGSNQKKRVLPYDNYGSFFGPSEPVVARRIIEDARAREEAESVSAKVAKEAPERIAKGSSGASRLASEPRAAETVKQQKPVSEVALKAQRLREARDYSFLFTDEDPPAGEIAHDVKQKNPEKEKTRQNNNSKIGSMPQKGPSQTKPSSVAKPMKTNSSASQKGAVSQENHLQSREKSLKPSGKPAVSHAKVSSGLASQSNKLISGPGRPSQGGTTASTSNVKKPVTPAVQSKKVVVTGNVPSGKSGQSSAQPNGVLYGKSGQSSAQPNGKIGLSSSHGFASPKVATGKAAISATVQKSAPSNNAVKKYPVPPEKKQQLPPSHPLQRPSVAVGRTPAGQLGLKKPAQSAGPSKHVAKPGSKPVDTRRVQKRPRESDSDDSFLDDDDDGGGDVSSMIRKMFGYNPNKYRDLDDEDDRMMEADFRTIQMEEKRSARIAREEDERELALIEEEERRERERARAKQRKLKNR